MMHLSMSLALEIYRSTSLNNAVSPKRLPLRLQTGTHAWVMVCPHILLPATCRLKSLVWNSYFSTLGSGAEPIASSKGALHELTSTNYWLWLWPGCRVLWIHLYTSDRIIYCTHGRGSSSKRLYMVDYLLYCAVCTYVLCKDWVCHNRIQIGCFRAWRDGSIKPPNIGKNTR